MGRPVKQTVEYFSHDAHASEGKTLSILFNHFGHEGISAWWLLLERISCTRNHVISTRNPEDLEFLSAKMHFKPERLREILEKMAGLEAIDPQLYAEGKIWSQNFVNRLEPLYKSRKQGLPSKPELLGKETQLLGKETPLSIPEIPHTKETKLKETKERKGVSPQEDSLAFTNYLKAHNGHLNQREAELIGELIDDYGDEVVARAIDKAIKADCSRPSYNYLIKILKDKTPKSGDIRDSMKVL